MVNALSDVYAMGGTPLTAMNLVAFPIKTAIPGHPEGDLAWRTFKIEGGGGCLGGRPYGGGPGDQVRSVRDRECSPGRILSNAKARPGDHLVLTKPLGTGMISTALKGGLASEEAVQKMVESMVTLNRKASERMQALAAHACTDITGFGFIGHALEMVKASGVGMIDSIRRDSRVS